MRHRQLLGARSPGTASGGARPAAEALPKGAPDALPVASAETPKTRVGVPPKARTEAPAKTPAEVPRGALVRWQVSYLRHALSRYEALLDGLYGETGRGEAERLLRRRLYEAIAAVYPALEGECGAGSRWRGERARGRGPLRPRRRPRLRHPRYPRSPRCL